MEQPNSLTQSSRNTHCSRCWRPLGRVFNDGHESSNPDGSCDCLVCVSMCWGDPLDCGYATSHRKTEELCLMKIAPKRMVWSSTAESLFLACREKISIEVRDRKLRELSVAIRSGKHVFRDGDDIEKINFLAGLQFGIALGKTLVGSGGLSHWDHQIIYARAIGTDYTYYFFEKDEQTLLAKLNKVLQPETSVAASEEHLPSPGQNELAIQIIEAKPMQHKMEFIIYGDKQQPVNFKLFNEKAADCVCSLKTLMTTGCPRSRVPQDYCEITND